MFLTEQFQSLKNGISLGYNASYYHLLFDQTCTFEEPWETASTSNQSTWSIYEYADIFWFRVRGSILRRFMHLTIPKCDWWPSIWQFQHSVSFRKHKNAPAALEGIHHPAFGHLITSEHLLWFTGVITCGTYCIFQDILCIRSLYIGTRNVWGVMQAKPQKYFWAWDPFNFSTSESTLLNICGSV